MKKFLPLALMFPIVFLAGVVFASSSFTDYDDIPDWAQDAAENMNEKGIVTGYEDGTFGPGDYVTRAQLVTVLERFDELVQDVAERKVQDMLFSLGDAGYIVLPEESTAFYVAALMADAGMKRSDMTLSDISDIHSCGEDEECTDPQLEVDGLPDGYSIYEGQLYEFYVVYEGFKNFGQDGWEVEEVYGPFSYYDAVNRYNSAEFY